MNILTTQKLYTTYPMNDIVLVHVLYCIVSTFILYLSLYFISTHTMNTTHNTRIYGYRPFFSALFSDIFKSLCSPKRHITALLLIIWLFTEILLIHLYITCNIYTMWTSIRISCMLSYTIEVIIRKGYTIHGTVLLLIGLIWYDISTLNTNIINLLPPSQSYVGNIIFICIVISALLRSLYMRTAQDTYSILSSTTIASVLLILLRLKSFPSAYYPLPILIPTDTTITSENYILQFFTSNLTCSCYILAYILYAYMIYSIMLLVRWSSPAFTIQVLTLPVICISWVYVPPSGHITYIAEIIFILVLVQISYESMQTILSYSNNNNNNTTTTTTTTATTANNNTSIPQHLLRIKQIEDIYRLLLTNAIITILVKPIINLCSIIAPRKLMYYMYPTPVHDLGENCG